MLYRRPWIWENYICWTLFCSLLNVHEFNLHYANHPPILSAAVKLHMNIIILISDVWHLIKLLHCHASLTQLPFNGRDLMSLMSDDSTRRHENNIKKRKKTHTLHSAPCFLTSSNPGFVQMTFNFQTAGHYEHTDTRKKKSAWQWCGNYY